jgi:sugar lactone lactonase YvrE
MVRTAGVPRAPPDIKPAQVTVAFDTGAELGEGALWDWRGNLLVSVDIPAGQVLVSDPRDGSTRSLEVGQPVGAAMLRGEHDLLLAVRDGFATLDLETGAVEPLVAVEADKPANRMNDAACDARGRCFAGTMATDDTPGAGTLYRLDQDLSVHAMLDGLTISNGLGWSPSGSVMYHIDSMAGGADAHDFDADSGALSGRRRLIDTDPSWGLPDGLAVDSEGGLWVAFWGGSAVRRFSPEGELTETLELPAARATRPAFGGANLDQLYVTSAKLDPEQTVDGDLGGAIFVLEPGVRGMRAHVFAG